MSASSPVTKATIRSSFAKSPWSESRLTSASYVRGEVERYELPNLGALNFLLHGALGGGGTLSLRVDAQGKTYSAALLRMEIEVNDGELRD